MIKHIKYLAVGLLIILVFMMATTIVILASLHPVGIGIPVLLIAAYFLGKIYEQ